MNFKICDTTEIKKGVFQSEYDILDADLFQYTDKINSLFLIDNIELEKFDDFGMSLSSKKYTKYATAKNRLKEKANYVITFYNLKSILETNLEVSIKVDFFNNKLFIISNHVATIKMIELIFKSNTDSLELCEYEDGYDTDESDEKYKYAIGTYFIPNKSIFEFYSIISSVKDEMSLENFYIEYNKKDVIKRSYCNDYISLKRYTYTLREIMMYVVYNDLNLSMNIFPISNKSCYVNICAERYEDVTQLAELLDRVMSLM